MSRGERSRASGRRESPPRDDRTRKQLPELKVKLAYEQEIRRCGTRSFAQLQEQTCSLFQLPPGSFALKYRDESDLVTVSNDKDLEECRRVQRSDTLHLSVCPLVLREQYSNRSRSPSPSQPSHSRSRSRSRSGSRSRSVYAPSHSVSLPVSRSPSPRMEQRRPKETLPLSEWEDENWNNLQALPKGSQNLMKQIVSDGRVTMKDFSPTIIPSLGQLPREVQMFILERFATADLNGVRSVSGFFIGLLKKARAQEKNGKFGQSDRMDGKRPRTEARDERGALKRDEEKREEQRRQRRRDEQRKEEARKEAIVKKEKEEREQQQRNRREEQRKKEAQRREEDKREEERKREQDRVREERREQEDRERKAREKRDLFDQKRAKAEERRGRTEERRKAPRETKRSPVRRSVDESPQRSASPIIRRTVHVSSSRSPSVEAERSDVDEVKKPRLLVKKRSGVEQEFRQSPEPRHELTVVKKTQKFHFHTVQKAQGNHKKTYTEDPPPVFMCRNHHKPRTLQHLHPLAAVPGEYVCKYGHECTNVTN